jgi:hypothetical protein
MDIAQLLLKTGRADVNTHSRAGKTPIEEAIMQNTVHTAALLLEAGADPSRWYAMDMELTDLPSNMRAHVQAMLARDPSALESPATKLAAQAHSGIHKMIAHCKARGRVGAGATLEGKAVRVIGNEGMAKPLHGMVLETCGPFDPYTSTYTLTPPGGPGGRTVKVPSHCLVAAAATKSSCCASCKSPAKFACSACKLAKYCSADCQKAHWSRHKVECRAARGKK